jgi:hypothetical protein
LISGECLVVDTLEKPFKTTKYLSKALQDDELYRLDYSETFLEKKGCVKTTQRVSKVDQSFVTSFPILDFKLSGKSSKELFFYEYGLMRGFYTVIESENAHALASERFKEMKGKGTCSNSELLDKFQTLSLEAFNSLK